MSRFFYFIGLSFSLSFFISCHRNEARYYLKEQWLTTSSKHFPVRSNPAEVIEYFYNGVSAIDTNIIVNSKAYDLYAYDGVGNLLKRELYYADSMGVKSIHQYKTDGYSISYFYQSRADIKLQKKYLFESVSGGKFRATNTSDSSDKKATYYSYKKNGDQVIIEQQFEDRQQAQIDVYDGQRPLTRTIQVTNNSISSTAVTQYYYGKDKGLDSIIEKSENASRIIFTRNKQGDPITELVIDSKNDTIRYLAYTYRYDDKGNWVRRVEEDHSPVSPYSLHQKYSLIIRRIAYR
jgi:hypothetical protein